MKRECWPPVVTDEDRRRWPGWSRMMDEEAERERAARTPDTILVEAGRMGPRRLKWRGSPQERLARLREMRRIGGS